MNLVTSREMFVIAKLITIVVLFGLSAGQAPVPNGLDGAFFGPLRLRSSSFLQCSKFRTRSLSGQCTHGINPTFGEARRAHFSYFNVDSSTMAGRGLKSARKISNIVSNQKADIFSARHLNDLLTFFGQFIDHNIVATPLSDEEEPIPADEGHEEAGPEEGAEEEKAFPFRRSMRVPTGEGDKQRPINTLPSAFDLAAVYGPNELRNMELRVNGSCKLKTSEGDLLPFNTAGLSNAPSAVPAFYLAGDHRANEHPVLTSLHTLWVREHNYLCDEIVAKYPFFPTRKLYETARRINIAQFQKVVYEEFFPAITGRRLPRYKGFRNKANPTLSSLFSTAAFRVGHTMVSEVITHIDKDGVRRTTPLRENFFVPANVAGGIDSFIRGAAQTKGQEIDVFVVDSLRNFLFDKVPDEEGPDLVALNLQRSRDHNIPSFNEVRRQFGLYPAMTFADITDDPVIQEKLARAYHYVDDVEAWIGMVAEKKVRGSSMGKTMLKVWTAEFERMRDGDQFFYLRKKAFPNYIRRLYPKLMRPVQKYRTRMFRDIIVRNTDISMEELNDEFVFKVPKAR